MVSRPYTRSLAALDLQTETWAKHCTAPTLLPESSCLEMGKAAAFCLIDPKGSQQ